MNERNFELARDLRRELHSHPELSMRESRTKDRIIKFLRDHTVNTEVRDMGRWACALRHGPEPYMALRADIDAVPVDEDPSFAPYASRCAGVGHKCGHDGHTASLAAFALELDAMPEVPRGVCMIFQHAEETGQGGDECSREMERIGATEVYAYHNFPTVPLGAVACPEGVAQFASVGAIAAFKGVKSHACYPENGRNPAFAIAEIVGSLHELTDGPHKGLVMATVIGISVGERAFGTSAGSGELLLTLRAEHEDELDALVSAFEARARDASSAMGIDVSFAYEDRFPETRNDARAVHKVLDASRAAGVPVAAMPERFRASEDFGYYTKRAVGAMFYIGDGEDHAPLHTSGFDFPDEHIRTAVKVFTKLLEAPPIG